MEGLPQPAETETSLGDDELIPVSAIEHYAYCARQCALIHVDQTFDENVYTIRGTQAHERIDIPGSELVSGVRYERAMPIWSERLGIIGKADLVELRTEGPFPVEYKVGRRRVRGPRFRPEDSSHPCNTIGSAACPCRGASRCAQGSNDDSAMRDPPARPLFPSPLREPVPVGLRGPRFRPEDLQVCAQGICLEEMMETEVPGGAVFYWTTRRRHSVAFTSELRLAVEETVAAIRAQQRDQRLPDAPNDARCKLCSLQVSCLPAVVAGKARIRGFQGTLFQVFDRDAEGEPDSD